jgi:hypothetical protein
LKELSQICPTQPFNYGHYLKKRRWC